MLLDFHLSDISSLSTVQQWSHSSHRLRIHAMKQSASRIQSKKLRRHILVWGPLVLLRLDKQYHCYLLWHRWTKLRQWSPSFYYDITYATIYIYNEITPDCCFEGTAVDCLKRDPWWLVGLFTAIGKNTRKNQRLPPHHFQKKKVMLQYADRFVIERRGDHTVATRLLYCLQYPVQLKSSAMDLSLPIFEINISRSVTELGWRNRCWTERQE